MNEKEISQSSLNFEIWLLKLRVERMLNDIESTLDNPELCRQNIKRLREFITREEDKDAVPVTITEDFIY